MTTIESSDFELSSNFRNVIASPVRPKPTGALEASTIFVWRALLKIKHVPEQLMDVTMFPIMFTVLFTFLFGGALAGSPQEYLQFLLPGILVQTVTWITMYTGMTINADIKQGTFNRFRSMPVWRAAHLSGALMADVLRFLMAATVVFTVGFILGYRPEGGAAGVITAIALILVFAFSLSWIWTLCGLKLRTPQAVLNTAMMIMFPLTFVSNVFVDPETMPGWVQAIVAVNPVSLLVDATRGFMGGNPDYAAVGWVLVYSAAICAVFVPLSLRRYSKI